MFVGIGRWHRSLGLNHLPRRRSRPESRAGIMSWMFNVYIIPALFDILITS
jgi:hypothetical protein